MANSTCLGKDTNDSIVVVDMSVKARAPIDSMKPILEPRSDAFKSL